MFAPSEQWIDLFTTTVHATMRRAGAVRNACVEAACIGVGVAREFGYLAEPVPVAVQVIAGKQATVLPGPDGRSKRRGGFAGHLILHFPAAGAFADLTADQFHDPRRGLLVPEPLCGPVTRADLTEGIAVDLPTGTRITYRERVGDVSWRALPAWYGPSTLTTAVAVRALRDALGRTRCDR